jgi:signal transduction histidine kinase
MASLLSDFQRQTGIEGRLTIDAGWPPRLRPAAAANLGGIVCEALANVRRHSEATHVTVTLQPRGESGVAIAISDDGRGLEPTVAAKPGLGIAGMRERALLLGAVLLVESQERIGTTISVVVPDGVVPVPVQPHARPAPPAGELTR